MNFEQEQKEKKYYFNEVTSITGVKPYVLRFWESEFEIISPEKTEDGSKFYSKSDVDTVFMIKTLLFDEKLSIPQAKTRLIKQCTPSIEESASTTNFEGDSDSDSRQDLLELEDKLHFLLRKIDSCISQNQWT